MYDDIIDCSKAILKQIKRVYEVHCKVTDKSYMKAFGHLHMEQNHSFFYIKVCQ